MRAVLIEQTDRFKEKASEMVREAEGQLTDFAKGAVRMKTAIADAIEDSMYTARRAMKHGYRATEEILDDSTRRIKRDPLRAVGLCFVAGLAAGWLLPRLRG
jgi:ElaB/YqjD/DUF883 family membrane-anchored ribosome-binding protein